MEKDKLVIEIMQYNAQENTYSDIDVKKERSSTQDFKDASIKKEKSESICRACLKEGDIPIFGSDSNVDLSGAFISFAGVSISSDDPYTKFLCKSCNMHLASAILFRNTAQHSDLLLKSTVIVDNSQDDDVQSDDNYFEIKVEKNELNIKHSQGRKKQTQKTVKVKKTTKSIGKGRQSSNKKNKDVNSKSTDMEAADPTSEDKNVLKNCSKGKKKNMPYCRKCNLTFNSFDDLNEHKQTEEHENNKEECPICHKMYATLYIKTHMNIHGNKTSTCDICGKSFRLALTLYQHRATHFYELPYKCTLCPYKGRFSQSLRLHMRTHTGEKPYQCTECSSAFITKSNLVAHARKHKKKEFHCEPCNKAFYTKRDLDLHHKVAHLGIKEHVCDVCGRAFGYRSKMMKHSLKVHKRAKLTYGRKPLYLQVESMKQQEENIPQET